jgi:hypothetical protein
VNKKYTVKVSPSLTSGDGLGVGGQFFHRTRRPSREQIGAQHHAKNDEPDVPQQPLLCLVTKLKNSTLRFRNTHHANDAPLVSNGRTDVHDRRIIILFIRAGGSRPVASFQRQAHIPTPHQV